MHCFEACGRVHDAEAEALRVLEKLQSVKKRKGKILPQLGGDDKDLCLLVVEIAVTLVRCAATGTGKENRDFKRVLDLVEELRPWLRYVTISLLCFPFIIFISYFHY